VTERLHEVALTSEEVTKILAVCGPRALLVGGQALAFWATYFNVEPVGELSATVTTDADFIGSKAAAKELLAALGHGWDIRIATMDDATGQIAKVFARVPGGGVKQVDFLAAIVGLDTRKVRERSVEVDLPSGARVQVLHPLDVLESRLRNLQTLPTKRNPAGVAQARLAIGVARKFIELMLDRAEKPRVVLRSVNRVIALALESRLAMVLMDFGVDVLDAVPASRIMTPGFAVHRWPQVQMELNALRRKHEARKARRTALKERTPRKRR
jgi:hypothetical protein